MSLIRWKQDQDLMTFPSDILNMHHSLNRMFDNIFRSGNWDEMPLTSAWNPAADVEERDNDYVVRVELAGVAKEDVNITIRENVLTIRGEKKVEKEKKESNYHRMERSYGSFQRSFTLPGDVHSDRIDALFKSGILEIVIPKDGETRSKTIEVKVQ